MTIFTKRSGGFGLLTLLAMTLAQPSTAQPGSPKRQDIPNLQAQIAAMKARYAGWAAQLPKTTGPFAVRREAIASLPEHTIYRPATLPKKPLPVIAFANGGCRNTPIEFTAFNAELASYGYVVIAAGSDDVEFALADFQKRMPDGRPLARPDPAALTSAIDWAFTENERRGSPFFHRLDTGKIAYAGQSCGGMQAITASRDPRTTTTVVLNSAQFDPNFKTPGGLVLPPSVAWDQLHAPIAFFVGGPSDLAYPYAEKNFAEIETLPLLLANLPVGHTGAYPEPDKRWIKAVRGWLDWRLKGDRRAATLFQGADCGLCRDPQWSVKSKNLGKAR